MTSRTPDYYPDNINQYVPAMGYSADVVHSGPTRVDFSTPAVADADAILDAAAADDSGPYTYTVADFLNKGTGFVGTTGKFTNCPFGRAITAVGSAAGVTQNLTVVGFDYLGQKISKTVAMNGTTPVAINVAYFRIESITIAVGASGETIDVGFSDALGMPFKAVKVLTEEDDGAPEGTLGTLTAPVLTDPATASTGDPRGLYNPNATLDGSANITGTFIFDDTVNASGNGGLHGIAHFGG
jgi:hypothetical protein